MYDKKYKALHKKRSLTKLSILKIFPYLVSSPLTKKLMSQYS